MTFRQMLALGFKRIHDKGLQHWVGVVAALLVGLYVSHLLQHQDFWQKIRFKVQRLIELSDVEDRKHSSRTVAVMIDDAEYGIDALRRTSPLSRAYLADLIAAIDSADPHVIALDVDLTRPEKKDYYADQTEILSKAISRVRKSVIVVLTYTVAGGPLRYRRNPGVLDGLDRTLANVRFGCVTLTPDKSQLAMGVQLSDGTAADAFATAIARAVDSRMIFAREALVRNNKIVSTFLPPGGVPEIRAADVRLRKSDALAQLTNKIVIIGGKWRVNEYLPPLVDQHVTPAGTMSGAILHANYVEALLAFGGVKKPVSGVFNVAMESVITFVVALIFVVFRSAVKRTVAMVITIGGIIVLSLFIFQNLGGSFDCSVVLLFLGLHALLENMGHAPRPRTLLNLRFACAVGVCILSLIGLAAQATDPLLTLEPASVAQVASLNILPVSYQLDTIGPPVYDFDDPVQATPFAPQTPAPKILMAESDEPPPATAPIEPQTMKLFARFQVAAPAQAELVRIAAHGVAEQPSFSLQATVDDRALQSFGKELARWKETTPPTSPVDITQAVSFSNQTELANVTIPDTYDPLGNEPSPPVLPNPQIEAAREAFDTAWWSDLHAKDSNEFLGTAADNKAPFKPRLKASPEGPSPDDVFESIAWRLSRSKARILEPTFAPLQVVVTVPASLYTSEGMLSTAALDALAVVAVEMRRNTDLSITVTTRDDASSRARQAEITGLLRFMRVESRRLLPEVGDVASGAIQLKLAY